MRAPEFWNHKYGRDAAPALRKFLSIAGWFYARATARRIALTKPYDPGIPVICVGNASVGGTGKTPVTAYLLESFGRMGFRAVALTRGYGGTQKGPLMVTEKHTHDQIGDEPLLLAKKGMVWVSADRDEGAKAAKTQGAHIIIMDDGHQNPELLKTLSLLVVDAQIGFGNEHVFPAGPLREPVETALARADAIILMKPYLGFAADRELLEKFANLPVISAFLTPVNKAPRGKLFAFAGIGRPHKFFDGLKRAGADVVEGLSFGNHYVYKDTDMKSLFDLAKEYAAQLITTEKDFVRIPKHYQNRVLVWPVKVQFEDELTLRRLLHPIIETAKT